MKPTKKPAWFLLFFLPVLFQACNKDEELTPKEMLIGAWTFSDQQIEVFADGMQVPESIYSQFLGPEDLELFPENTIVEFKPDNTFMISAPDKGEGTGTWALSDDAKSLTIDTGDTDAIVFHVETLTNNSAVLTYSQEGNVDTGEGDTINVRVDAKISFVK